MFVVFIERSGEPTATRALMRLEPGDSSLDRGLGSRHARFAKYEDGETRAVTVARLQVLLFAVRAGPRIQPRKGPATSRSFGGQQFLDVRLLLIRSENPIDVGRSPQAHSLVM